jgi:glycosyltransferase involved in cell wall biosynthesis
MKPVKFSIITVTRNSERYLDECMTSVLGQERADLEYILIDGGSVDGTLAIIKKAAQADPRISWISESDRGISDAFNKGLARAKGEIIGILNSDDAYAPGALASVDTARHNNPDCDIFHGDMLRFSEDTPLFRLIPGTVDNSIWHEMPLNHPATFVTRQAYGVVGGFDLNLSLAMDYDLVLRLYLAGFHFHHIPAVLAHMRYGGASDDRFIGTRREVVDISIRAGYSPLKARFWFIYSVAKGCIKNLLRRTGMKNLLQLHPRFNSTEK